MSNLPKALRDLERFASMSYGLVGDPEGRWVNIEDVAEALSTQPSDGRISVEEETLECVEEFYSEALGLIADLLKDAERIYEPGFEDPPHIRAAKNLGDHEETLRLVRAALTHNPQGAKND